MTSFNRNVFSRRGFLGGAAASLALPAAAGLLPTGRAHAAAPLLGTQVPAWYRFKIGDYEATVVSDGPIILGSPQDQFPSADPAVVANLVKGDFLPADNTPLEQNCLVLNTGDKLVLIDTGMGSDQMFGPYSGRLMKSLAAAGFKGEQFDAVVLTHAHCDHCWGIMDDDGNRNFPNAQVYISQADFDFWTDEAKLGANDFVKDFVAGARRNLLPNQDRLIYVKDGDEILPGIQAIASPGHTVGHTSYLITSNGETALFVGDVVHHYKLLFENPAWEFAFDSDPAQAAQTRLRVFDMASKDELPLIGYHFPFPGIGYIAPQGNAYRYVPRPMDFTFG